MYNSLINYTLQHFSRLPSDSIAMTAHRDLLTVCHRSFYPTCFFGKMLPANCAILRF